MSRYPRAIWKPLPEAGQEYTPSRKRLLIYHSIVGSALSAYGYFRDGTSLESTLILPYQGVPWQIMEFTDSADANYHVNAIAISVETEDNKDPNHDPWTASQLEELVAFGIWCVLNPEFDIPPIRATGPFGEGIGWHAMWGSPSDWTPAVGKTCPGYIRRDQFEHIVLPRIIAGATQPAPVLEDDEMDAPSAIRTLYLVHLGREPDTQGLEGFMIRHAIAVASGATAISSMFAIDQTIYNSPEAVRYRAG